MQAVSCSLPRHRRSRPIFPRPDQHRLEPPGTRSPQGRLTCEFYAPTPHSVTLCRAELSEPPAKSIKNSAWPGGSIRAALAIKFPLLIFCHNTLFTNNLRSLGSSAFSVVRRLGGGRPTRIVALQPASFAHLPLPVPRIGLHRKSPSVADCSQMPTNSKRVSTELDTPFAARRTQGHTKQRLGTWFAKPTPLEVALEAICIKLLICHGLRSFIAPPGEATGGLGMAFAIPSSDSK